MFNGLFLDHFFLSLQTNTGAELPASCAWFLRAKPAIAIQILPSADPTGGVLLGSQRLESLWLQPVGNVTNVISCDDVRENVSRQAGDDLSHAIAVLRALRRAMRRLTPSYSPKEIGPKAMKIVWDQVRLLLRNALEMKKLQWQAQRRELELRGFPSAVFRDFSHEASVSQRIDVHATFEARLAGKRRLRLRILRNIYDLTKRLPIWQSSTRIAFRHHPKVDVLMRALQVPLRSPDQLHVVQRYLPEGVSAAVRVDWAEVEPPFARERAIILKVEELVDWRHENIFGASCIMDWVAELKSRVPPIHGAAPEKSSDRR